MSTAPLFIVTNAGLAAASVATPVGPFIHVTQFRVGSGFGYEAQPTDTDINGTLLYQGVPQSYEYVGDNTINILCKIPADAGPFDFGEVAIDLDGPVMFAKAVFDTPQTKYTSLGTNVLSTFTFNCLLKLEQPVAIFKVTTEGPAPSIWEVDLWSDVYPPALSANPSIPAILVRELDPEGNTSLIHQASDMKWTIGTTYKLVDTALLTGSSTTTVDIAKNQLSPFFETGGDGDYIMEWEGYIRSVKAITVVGANYHFEFNPEPWPVAPTVGSTIFIYGVNIISTEPVFEFFPAIAPNGTVITLRITNAKAFTGTEVSVTNMYSNGLYVGPVVVGTIDDNGFLEDTSVTAWGPGANSSVATLYLNGINFKTFTYVSGVPIPSGGGTTLNLTGDVVGSGLINGGVTNLYCQIDHQAILARSQEYNAPGIYNFVVPADVFELFYEGGSAGGGGGGAGGGSAVESPPNQEYLGGGGGGGGGAGNTVTGQSLVVNPGDTVTVQIGAGGLGGPGGIAPGYNGTPGTDGADTIITHGATVITIPGGTGGIGGDGFGAPSGLFGGGGAPGLPGGSYGIDGLIGGAGGTGGSSPYGTGGFGGRGSAVPSGTGVPGGDADGNSSGGGGAGAVYKGTSTTTGAPGADGTPGIVRFTW